MRSLRTRFIIVFGLFILISCSVMGVFSAFSIIKTGVALCSEQGLPIAKKANEVIDGEFELDKKMVKLFIFAKMKNNQELIFDENNKNVKTKKLE